MPHLCEHDEKQRLELLARLRGRALSATAEWSPARCRMYGAGLCALAAGMAAFHPLFWRGTRIEWASTFWPLAVVVLWVWALASWLALSFYKYN